MNHEAIIANLEEMPDKRLEDVIEHFPDFSLLAQLILDERRKRQGQLALEDEHGTTT